MQKIQKMLQPSHAWAIFRPIFQRALTGGKTKSIQGESKKRVISGILADFGNFFFQPVMATNIIENFTIFEIF